MGDVGYKSAIINLAIGFLSMMAVIVFLKAGAMAAFIAVNAVSAAYVLYKYNKFGVELLHDSIIEFLYRLVPTVAIAIIWIIFGVTAS